MSKRRRAATVPRTGHINAFLGTIDLSEFRIAVEQRRGLAKKLEKLQASQRATAKTLGVGKTTVQEDLNGRKRPPEPPADETESGGNGRKRPPSQFATSVPTRSDIRAAESIAIAKTIV